MRASGEIIRIAGAFVGVLVGAGFASGQEILQFFASFGRLGLVGSVIAGLVFVFLAMALSTLAQRLHAHSHKEVIHALLGRHLGLAFDALITFFLFAITVVMLAGAGSLLQQWLGWPEVWGSVLATVATVLIVCLDLGRVIALIGAVTPLLMFMTLVVTGYVLATPHAGHEALAQAAAQQPRGAGHWLVAALLYVSYNLVAGLPFLVIMGGQASSRRNALWGGVLGGLLLGVLMLLIAAAMYWRMDSLSGVSMPMLALATQISPWLGHLMSLVIFGMILNTAVGMLYAFVARITPTAAASKRRFRTTSAIAGALALAGSFVGFIQLVGTVYPAYGYIGFVLMACTLVGWLRLAKGRPAAE
ncbi:membrane protein [Diaphorobacter sp. J5-51]|uniref:YkvI family membrane protein n=1 Tax=Diaphorobacter sp. J5-51 TaxID=680496 RepID=UPI0006432FD7|nr:membrane protein [Diaphorobacter sp. J5-51]KLR57053.1 membrane protein [Diaphorobacter sp. J5-51]